MTDNVVMTKNIIKVYCRLKQEENKRRLARRELYKVQNHKDYEEIVFNYSISHKQNPHHRYKFHKIFDEEATQQEVFETVAKPIVKSAVQGYNGTIFAYGQTGSGKTYTITGSPRKYDERGIIPRSIQEIFTLIRDGNDKFTIHISYLEIYNEIGYDLINPHHTPSCLEEFPKSVKDYVTNNTFWSSSRVTLLEDEKGEAHVRNLSIQRVHSEQEAMRLLYIGDTNRTIAETPMNQYSSRSHCIFTIYIRVRSNCGRMTKSKLHLVDLAGSERIFKSQISGITLSEAKYINLSLHYLERVILALSESKRAHIPFRNSMMTLMLKDSLSGNTSTVMLATVAANEQNILETLSTCKFAQRVALIKIEAVVNEVTDPNYEIHTLKKQIEELKEQIETLSKSGYKCLKTYSRSEKGFEFEEVMQYFSYWLIYSGVQLALKGHSIV